VGGGDDVTKSSEFALAAYSGIHRDPAENFSGVVSKKDSSQIKNIVRPSSLAWVFSSCHQIHFLIPQLEVKYLGLLSCHKLFVRTTVANRQG
jgi:hypothetical protein